jgi:hypothetical protein
VPIEEEEEYVPTGRKMAGRLRKNEIFKTDGDGTRIKWRLRYCRL